jgi:hypothetical protein
MKQRMEQKKLVKRRREWGSMRKNMWKKEEVG